jgi:hypothetical protein
MVEDGVSADYEKIRDENIARYGWDTAVLDLLGQLYSERTHFIFELIQNAEDAGASELAFELFGDRLEVRHDGRPFTEADVRGVCGVGQSSKSGDLVAIGKFGIGFKAVYAYTKSPRIYSGGEHFRIESYVRPFGVKALGRLGTETLFVFPFDLETVPAVTAVREIGSALGAISPGTLLFLRNISRLRTGADGADGADGAVISRSVTDRVGSRRRVTLSRDLGLDRGPARVEEEWLVWERHVAGVADPAAGTEPAPRIEIAFRVSGDQIVACGRSPLTVFFPTEKETFLGLLIQGPYRTTPARDNVPGDDPSNRALVRETAELLADVLRELADEGLLTVEVLATLPLDAARFEPGSMFRPLFEMVRAALAAEPLLPAMGDGYRTAAELKLAHDGGLERAHDGGLEQLLDPDQLGALYGAGRAVFFVDCAAGAELRRYLSDEIGVEEVTAADVVSRLTGDFLQAQPDEWIARLYGFLAADSALWRAPRFGDEPPGPARAKPIIRLEDGRQVTAFDAEDRPAVYLPGPAASSLPTVRRAIADSPVGRPFLTALNLSVPDVVAEVLDIILPGYDDLDIGELDLAKHDADLDAVMRALDDAAPGPREELLTRLAGTALLIGENAAGGEPRLMPPPSLYQRSKDLEVYFDQNPDAWFAADRYGPWLVQLRGMGVRQAVEVRARAANQLGYVVIVVDFGRNERGLDGFDPQAEIDGLDFALRHPNDARSEYVWNVLLVPNRRLIAGVVEKSVLQSFSDSQLEQVQSAIAVAAEREAWLPGRDGIFCRPGELSLDDLPPTYARDEGLAQGLQMLQPVVGQAARRLGVPAEVLWGLSEHPDLVALVERELAARDEPDAL